MRQDHIYAQMYGSDGKALKIMSCLLIMFACYDCNVLLICLVCHVSFFHGKGSMLVH